MRTSFFATFALGAATLAPQVEAARLNSSQLAAWDASSSPDPMDPLNMVQVLADQEMFLAQASATGE